MAYIFIPNTPEQKQADLQELKTITDTEKHMKKKWFFLFCPFSGNKEKTFFYSHPKLKKLEEVIIEHFRSWNGE